jgi:hypothetical protein
MLPAFNEHGYLPAGIHAAPLDEVNDRFGTSTDLRRAEAQSLRWLIPLCRTAGIARLIVNGSFVTDVAEPNDVDCVLLQGDGYNELSIAAAELERGLPFLSIQVVREEAFGFLAERFFATDRAGRAKGVVEIIYDTQK